MGGPGSNTAPLSVAHASNGLSVRAHRGDGGVLLAFNLNKSLTAHLAGFAVKYTAPDGQSHYVSNRLSFNLPITSTTSPAQRTWTPSDKAPLQKFRWVHYPADIKPGKYKYEVTAMYFDGVPDGSHLKAGTTVAVEVELDNASDGFANFEMGFTRGYLSSQAYAFKFHNAPYAPSPRTIDFDTAPYENRYTWLGFHARRLLLDFLAECAADPQITVDAFAYDLDEPDFVRGLVKLGGRLRVVLDNAALHTKPASLEKKAKALLEASAGAQNVRVGHFQRFAHCKVVIQKKNGVPTKVLTGSANFSVRGLYVQANNVLVFNDAHVAKLYEDAFEQAFTDMAGFDNATIASKWWNITATGLPTAFVSFSPHATSNTSLNRVAQAIHGAKSSVLYAIMDIGGSGKALKEINDLQERTDVFSYGMTQTSKSIHVQKPGQLKKGGVVVPFAYLKDKVPPPFNEEWSGGMGQVIHHKFVVVDFNDTAPVVFTGSSNLAGKGEEQNGDNLLAIYDPRIATVYAVEAVRLVDHYQFRAAMKTATTAKPLELKPDGEQWWAPYYDPDHVKMRDRETFAKA